MVSFMLRTTWQIPLVVRKWQLYKWSGVSFPIATGKLKVTFDAEIDILDSSTRFLLKYSHRTFWPLLQSLFQRTLKRCIYCFRIHSEVSEETGIQTHRQASPLPRRRMRVMRLRTVAKPRTQGSTSHTMSHPGRCILAPTAAMARPVVRKVSPCQEADLGLTAELHEPRPPSRPRFMQRALFQLSSVCFLIPWQN